jgi:hypothetical protein
MRFPVYAARGLEFYKLFSFMWTGLPVLHRARWLLAFAFFLVWFTAVSPAEAEIDIAPVYASLSVLNILVTPFIIDSAD